MPTELRPDELFRSCDPRDIPFESTAEEPGFALAALRRNEAGNESGNEASDEPIDAEAFARLPDQEQAELRAAMEQVSAELTALLRTFHEWAREQLEALLALDRETAAAVAHRVVDGVRAGYRELPAVLAYLGEVENDVIEGADRFLPGSDDEVPEALLRVLRQHGGEDRFRRSPTTRRGCGTART